MSPFAKLVVRLVEANRNGPVSDAEKALIEDAVESHGYETDAPQWACDFVECLAEGSFTETLVNLPETASSMDVGNIFADTGLPELRWDDYGEGIVHNFVGSGVHLFLSREGSPMFYAVRPIGTRQQMNTWLHQQYQKRR